MKSNPYVLIDAHIIRCRLHHTNSNKYSVSLRSSAKTPSDKDPMIATEFKASKDLMIQMDTHLTLQADKHAYDNFPKLTLVVNAMFEDKQKKAVGSTFANFKKEGLQVFKVSECSCKDKAFQVEIIFTTKLIEVKSSKTKVNKILQPLQKKMDFFSHQPSPHDSREIKLERLSNPLKDNTKMDNLKRLKQIKSEKILSIAKQQQTLEQLQKQIKALSEQLEYQAGVIHQLEIELKLRKQGQEMFQELLHLEEEKNKDAMSYIIQLQHAILGLLPKQERQSSKGCQRLIEHFKVIEEKDEIIQINQELECELLQEKETNHRLSLEVSQLKVQLERLRQLDIKRSQAQTQVNLKIQNEVVSIDHFHSEILISSRCKNLEVGHLKEETQKRDSLIQQICHLEERLKGLQEQFKKVSSAKKELQKDPKIGVQVKKTAQGKPPNAVRRQQQTRKSEKITNSKQKNIKSPIKSQKKGSNPASQTSNFVIANMSSKKSLGTNSDSGQIKSVAKYGNLAQTEVQSKTEREESVQKSYDILSNQIRSEQNLQKFNEMISKTDGFKQEIIEF